MDEGMHPHFPEKVRPRISQELQRDNTYIHSSQNIQCPTTKPHRTPNLTTFLGKTKMASEEKDPWPHKYWLSVESLKAYEQKIYRRQYYLSTLPRPLIPFTERRWKTYSLPEETVAAIMILYRNTKVKVRSPDGDRDYFDFLAWVQQGDTLAPYLFIICLDYVIRKPINKIEENSFKLTKKRRRRYLAKTITDANNSDDIALLANATAQAETLLHSLEPGAAGISLHINVHKIEYMCFNQTGDISTLNGSSLKLVDKFTYLGNSVSSTEKDIDTRLWKSDLTDKIKHSFFQLAVVSILLYGCITWTLTKRIEKKLDGNYPRILRAIFKNSLSQHHPQKAAIRPPSSHHENYPS